MNRLPQSDSRPVRYELIDKDGNVCGIFGTASTAAIIARQRWPDQEQDEDRTGVGWDIQAVR